MTDKLEFAGEVKHNETNYRSGKIGFWLGRKSDNIIKRFFDKITPSMLRFREYQISVPAEEEEVYDWKNGQRVMIEIKNLDKSLQENQNTS